MYYTIQHMTYAVGYCRVSTDEQVLSIEEQEEIIRKACEKKGWHLINVFKDIGISGSTNPFERPGFKKCFEILEKHGGGIIIAYSIDRITRASINTMYDILKKLFDTNIMVYTIRESYLFDIALQNPLMYHFMLSVISFVSSIELQMIRERTKAIMQREDVRKKIRESLKARGCKLHEELSEDMKNLIVKLYEMNLPIRKISRITNLSTYLVRKVLVEKGVLKLREDECPRCFHKLKLEPYSTPLRKIWRCEHCGYMREETKT